MNARGFSLIEIAIVLVIISVLVTIVAVPLSTQIEQRRLADTEKQLETIKEAIVGFAIANGRFPCASRPSDNGVESIVSPTSGVCNSYSGLLPAVTLGLSPIDANGFAIDAWQTSQNRIRYAVMHIPSTSGSNCPTVPVTEPFTKKGGMNAATMECLASYNNDVSAPYLTLISVCAQSPTTSAPWPQPFCAASKLTVSAPFVLISQGKNAPTGAALGSDEAFNAGTKGDGTVFVARNPSAAGALGGEFDDIVVWPSLNTIFGRMVQAGKLP